MLRPLYPRGKLSLKACFFYNNGTAPSKIWISLIRVSEDSNRLFHIAQKSKRKKENNQTALNNRRLLDSKWWHRKSIFINFQLFPLRFAINTKRTLKILIALLFQTNWTGYRLHLLVKIRRPLIWTSCLTYKCTSLCLPLMLFISSGVNFLSLDG